jgi:acyl-CoA synthetase (NDP forming)
LKTYPNVKYIPDSIDLAFITVPASAVPEVLEDCVAKNVGAVVILTAGFGETGKEEGRKLEREIAKISKEEGLRVVGPNCFGIYCPSSGLTLLPGANFSRESGNVAFLSQSGGYAERFCQEAKGWGIRFSKVVSYGNACDLNETDFTEYLAEDPETEIIALYLEGVKGGERFLETVRDVSEEKPVIVWKGGLSEGGGRAVTSHTGALGGRKDIWDAFFRQTGAVRVNSLEELIDTTIIFQHLSSSCGRRFAVIGTGGGTGVAAADSCERAGLRVPAFNTKTLEQLQALIPPVGASIQNPIDLGNPWTPPSTYRRIIKVASSDSQIDASIIVMWHLPLFHARRELMWEFFQQVIEVPITIGEKQRKPVVMVLCATPTEVEMLEVEGEWRRIKNRYLSAGIPVFPTVERAAKALSNFVAYHEFQKHETDLSTKVG